jgi:HSP20 family protein
MLLRFDPFRDLDRLADEAFRATRPAVRPLPMEARRFEDRIELRFDVPGVTHDDLDLTVERDTLTLTAERRASEDGEVIAAERPVGRFTRQLVLGDNLDTDALEADYADGVLTVTIPLAAQATARKVAVGHGAPAIGTTTSDASAA